MESEDHEQYDQMLLLDRLEGLLEDMDELGVRTREEIVARIYRLHQALDERTA